MTEEIGGFGSLAYHVGIELNSGKRVSGRDCDVWYINSVWPA